jgi:menaquinone-9 beta-reductase
MDSKHFDLAIIGAGPAGCTLALNLGGSGMRIAIIEKDHFPREKICGDALSGKVVSILKRMPGGIFTRFLSHPGKTASGGIRFVAPDLSSLFLEFPPADNHPPHAPGYIFPRRDFDQFLVNEVKGLPAVTFFEGEKVNSVTREQGFMKILTDGRSITAGMVAFADGVASKTSEQVSQGLLRKNRISVGLRAYYKNITGFDKEGSIELFFLKDILPCYMWIFPPVNGVSNAGIGMLQEDILRKRVSLQSMMEQCIREVPELSRRFVNAERISPFQAHPLPLWRRGNKLSGNRFILLGDAASLVDPFTGEGIGNAMASGEVAAGIILDCFRSSDFSAKSLSEYDRKIRKRLNDLKTGSILLSLAHREWLFNLVVKLGNRNKLLRKFFYSRMT